jgi:hypothetical protein
MREKTGGADLVRPAATRFATAFFYFEELVQAQGCFEVFNG